ncbi:MAG TPA: peptidylprolyl isomerase [Ruminococcaceae bacterium]|nr:peptidylprolyl isomerase [Oscillospiraceae bacterium]
MKKSYKLFALLLCLSVFVSVFTACSGKTGGEEDASGHQEGNYSDYYVDRTTNKVEKKYGSHPQVKFTVAVEGGETGEFTMELYPEYAPETCKNFMKLVKKGFYNGLTFHRIRENFMIQGGDPKGDGTGGSSTIKGEFSANGFDNPISHTRGVVSMARRADDYDSGSCQFFVCYSDNYASTLDGQYAAFGKVIDGMLFLDSLTELEMDIGSDGQYSSPKTKVVIQSAELFNVSEGETAVAN